MNVRLPSAIEDPGPCPGAGEDAAPGEASRIEVSGIVVIGRNEGERLKRCLLSLPGERVVYVDSGSTDGSQDFARARGARVVELAVPPKFTAARARNAGLAVLLGEGPIPEYIQMVDGDCVVDPGWIAAGTAALRRDPGLAGVFGRLVEAAPERSLYNRLCDLEWDGPAGPAASTGGNALFRTAALRQVGGYAEALIAGEEPDMCLRMARTGGWRFARLEATMATHDAAMTRFRQWWRRARRGGYAAAEHVARHGEAALAGDRAQVRRMLIWGLALPAVALAALLLAARHPALPALAVVILATYPARAIRLARRDRHRFPSGRQALAAGTLGVIVHFAALSGFVRHRLDRLTRRDRAIIEYK